MGHWTSERASGPPRGSLAHAERKPNPRRRELAAVRSRTQNAESRGPDAENLCWACVTGPAKGAGGPPRGSLAHAERKPNPRRRELAAVRSRTQNARIARTRFLACLSAQLRPTPCARN